MAPYPPPGPGSRSRYQRQSTTEAMIKSVARSAATSFGRALARGILGSLKKGR